MYKCQDSIDEGWFSYRVLCTQVKNAFKRVPEQNYPKFSKKLFSVFTELVEKRIKPPKYPDFWARFKYLEQHVVI